MQSIKPTIGSVGPCGDKEIKFFRDDRPTKIKGNIFIIGQFASLPSQILLKREKLFNIKVRFLLNIMIKTFNPINVQPIYFMRRI